MEEMRTHLLSWNIYVMHFAIAGNYNVTLSFINVTLSFINIMMILCQNISTSQSLRIS